MGKQRSNIIIKLILVLVFIAGFVAVLHIPFLKDIMTSDLGTLMSGICTAIVAFYAIIEFEQHLRDKKTELLCSYNERYSTDKNIEKVVKLILGEDTADAKAGVFEKEIFMRFFEELNIQIEHGKLDECEVKNLFSYYALEFHNNDDLHKDITDYGSKDVWGDFHKFIERMGGKVK